MCHDLPRLSLGSESPKNNDDLPGLLSCDSEICATLSAEVPPVLPSPSSRRDGTVCFSSFVEFSPCSSSPSP